MVAVPHRFIIHSQEQAFAALDISAGLAQTAILLESPPGVVLRQGIGWFQAIEAACRQRHPAAKCAFLIDCDDAAGLALAALRLGFLRLRVRLDGRALQAVRDVADQLGATLETATAPALDLGPVSHLKAAISTYLQTSPNAPR
jgi:hypothetical protein